MRRALAFVVAAALSLACQSARSSPQSAGIVLPATAPTGVSDDVWQDARSFYIARSQEFAWVTGDKPTALAGHALNTLRTVEDHGLDPNAYGEPALRESMAQLQSASRTPELAQTLTDFDVRLTLALLQAARHVAAGRLSPAVIEPRWNVRRSLPAMSELLASAHAGNIDSLFERAQPIHPEYRALRAALTALRSTAAAEETPDDVTSEVHRVAINLERWRWMPDDLGRRHVLVNVPTYHLSVRENGNPVLDMRVVVGRRGNETPLFHDQIKTVVFSPYWNIPEAIADKETVPAARRDPLFLSRSNIEILDGEGAIVSPDSIDWDDPTALEGLRLRQRPGRTNALGSVKFVFPNEHAVYLHDTNAPALFKRKVRALSHGCVRIEQPENLAQYVLRGQPQWTQTAIREAMHAGIERHVPLAEHLPVYITYMTAWVDGSGVLQFADDVYGYDLRQARQ